MSALSLAGLWLSAVVVEGSATCPSPADVSAELASLLPPSSAPPGLRVEVESWGEGVRLDLREPSGALLGTRVLEGSPRCADLAAASAVVIASWVAGLRSGAPPERIPSAPAPLRPAVPERLSVEVAAGAALTYSDGLSLGALVRAALIPPRRGLGGQLTLAALGAHRISQDSSTVTWQRFALALGPHRRFRPGLWKIDLQADALAALLVITADSRASGISRTAFDPGLSVGVRVLSEPGFWVGTFASGWFRAQPVGGASPSTLPRLELFLTAGVAWGTE